ncbi:hypothetical protein GCM10011499_07620 [Pelagibacterium lentulum]|uniref:HTH IS21-type domain-containing protein n=1 Tax=Pelagibacterium lentulum TaxID=2029865 RepID=A0A916R735_9HYPH|nr:hypothetical protein GCM10011499_07620 [Pelagibacterium lentulum]
MAFLSVIRRWHFRDGFSIREISRRTGLSRNTIRKYLRSDTVEPKFKVPERPSKIDPFAEKLSSWLKAESRKPRNQRRTVKQIHADLTITLAAPSGKLIARAISFVGFGGSLRGQVCRVGFDCQTSVEKFELPEPHIDIL